MKMIQKSSKYNGIVDIYQLERIKNSINNINHNFQFKNLKVVVHK